MERGQDNIPEACCVPFPEYTELLREPYFSALGHCLDSRKGRLHWLCWVFGGSAQSWEVGGDSNSTCCFGVPGPASMHPSFPPFNRGLQITSVWDQLWNLH